MCSFNGKVMKVINVPAVMCGINEDDGEGRAKRLQSNL